MNMMRLSVDVWFYTLMIRISPSDSIAFAPLHLSVDASSLPHSSTILVQCSLLPYIFGIEHCDANVTHQSAPASPLSCTSFDDYAHAYIELTYESSTFCQKIKYCSYRFAYVCTRPEYMISTFTNQYTFSLCLEHEQSLYHFHQEDCTN